MTGPASECQSHEGVTGADLWLRPVTGGVTGAALRVCRSLEGLRGAGLGAAVPRGRRCVASDRRSHAQRLVTRALPDSRAAAADWWRELSARPGRGHGGVISGGGGLAPSPQRVPAQHGGRRPGRAVSAAALARRGGDAAAAAPPAGPGGSVRSSPAPPPTVRGCGRRGLLRGGLVRAAGSVSFAPAHRPFALGGAKGEGDRPLGRGLGNSPRGVLGWFE